MTGQVLSHRTYAPPVSFYRIVFWVVLALLATLLSAAPLKWAGVGLAGIALGALVLAQPAAGLVLVALAIPYGSLVQLPGLGFNAVDVLVGLTAAGWLARGVIARRIVFHCPPLTWPLLLFVWCAGLSLTQALSWRDGLPEWFKWAEYAALYLIATQVLNRRSATWTLIALLVAGTLQTIVGAYQFFYQVGPEAFILQGRFLPAPTAASANQIRTRGTWATSSPWLPA